jgi:uncharacterized protein (DUF4415 family)
MSVMRRIRLPTAEEDAAIDAGIAADADTAELTDREFAELKPLRGRPRGSRKVAMTVRFDREVIDAFRATGRGWQTRMNQVLREWLAAQRPSS